MRRPGQPVISRARSKRPVRGRLLKFSSPATSVRLTLPTQVIKTLRSIDEDLNRALVRVVRGRGIARHKPSAELTSLSDRSAVILLPYRHSLTERVGLALLPLPDGRAMLCLDGQQTVADVELQLSNAFADPDVSRQDRALLQELVGILRNARHDESVVIEKRRIPLLARRSPQPGR